MKTNSSLLFCVFCSFLISLSICTLATLVWAGDAQQNDALLASSFDIASSMPQRELNTPAEQDTSSLVAERTNPIDEENAGTVDTRWELNWIDSAVKAKRSERTQLGVHVRSPDDTVRSHLRLANGVGLVVEFVVPESAAAEGNIQVHDVLSALDDQILINDAQLRTLIEMKKPGDEVRLALIRQGKAAEVTVVLKAGAAPSSIELLDFRNNHLPESALAAMAQVHNMAGNDIQNCRACHVVSRHNPTSHW